MDGSGCGGGGGASSIDDDDVDLTKFISKYIDPGKGGPFGGGNGGNFGTRGADGGPGHGVVIVTW